MRKLALVLLSAFLLQGCYSYAGPYVTKVASDGPDTLDVEKCQLKMNVWTAHFQDVNCATEKVKLGARAGGPSR